MENNYKIVEARNPPELAEVVNGWMDQGWIPTGGMTAVPKWVGGLGSDADHNFMQAMIKNPARI